MKNKDLYLSILDRIMDQYIESGTIIPVYIIIQYPDFDANDFISSYKNLNHPMVEYIELEIHEEIKKVFSMNVVENHITLKSHPILKLTRNLQA